MKGGGGMKEGDIEAEIENKQITGVIEDKGEIIIRGRHSNVIL